MRWWNEALNRAGRKSETRQRRDILPTLEIFLAHLPDQVRDRYLAMYLETVDRRYREQERGQLLALVAEWQEIFDPPLAGDLHLGATRIERRVDLDLETPLFDFSVPDVAGCSVSIQAAESRTTSATWRVALGTGGGVTRKVVTSSEATFKAGPGESKRVFLPVPAVAVRRYQFPGYVGSAAGPLPRLVPDRASGFDEVCPMEMTSARSHTGYEGYSPVPAVRSMPVLPPEVDRTVAAYRLTGDPSGGLAEYKYTEEQSTEYQLTSGGNALGMQVNTSSSVALSTRMTVQFVLATGHDYYLKQFLFRPGVRAPACSVIVGFVMPGGGGGGLRWGWCGRGGLRGCAGSRRRGGC